MALYILMYTSTWHAAQGSWGTVCGSVQGFKHRGAEVQGCLLLEGTQDSGKATRLKAQLDILSSLVVLQTSFVAMKVKEF